MPWPYVPGPGTLFLILVFIGSIYVYLSFIILTIDYNRPSLHIPSLTAGPDGFIFTVVCSRAWSALVGNSLGFWDVDFLVELVTDAEAV